MTAHVAIAADSSYMEHALVTIRSVVANAGGPGITVHFLHGPDLSDDWAERLGDAASAGGAALDLVEIDPARLDGVPQRQRRSLANWYRILLPDLLEDVGAILYLDADAVAADDLAPLLATPLGDAYVAAVDDLFGNWLHPREPRRLAPPPGQRYFNAGVMLLNLAAMRADGLVPQLLAHGRFMGDAAYLPNQDSLNAVLGVRRVALDIRWNLMTAHFVRPRDAAEIFGRDAYAAAVERPGIRHFEGRAKPWNHGRLPGRELYLAHA